MSREPRPAGQATPPIVKPKACDGCRLRKVKCDKASPCSNCSRWSVVCTYPSPVRRCPRPLASRISSNRSEPLDNSVGTRKPATSHIARIDDPEPWTSPTQAQTCWQYYTQRVDPVVKVLHRPSTERILNKVAHHDAIPLTNGEDALLSAIYFSGIASMTSEEARELFPPGKDTVLRVYRQSVEQALARVVFHTIQDLDTLQALVLFLSIRSLQGQTGTAWNLNGLARRSTIFSQTGLSPFEREMRNRVWWQLWYLDSRAQDDLGQEKEEDRDRNVPELPLNLNDSDFDASSFPLPSVRTGWTEVTFALIRFEIALTRSKLSRDNTVEQNQRLICECETRLQTTYLQHRAVTPTEQRMSIQWLAEHVAHVLVMEMWFDLYSADTISIPISSDSTLSLRSGSNHRHDDQEVQDRLFILAIDIVDIDARVKTEPQSKLWTWLLSGYQQFRPLAFLLNELCYRQQCGAVDHAWAVVQSALARWPDQVRNSRNGMVLVELARQAEVIRERIDEGIGVV